MDLGTWCLTTNTYSLDRGEIGKNDYFFAEGKCGERGGYLPTAGQLISAADEVRLRSTIDDKRLTANIDEDPSDGLKDTREMSATLVTTAAGSSASGSIGVSPGSKGDPRQGEPDPFPQPRDPAPSTLQYVTVFDNGNRGGFAGSKPVGEPEAFAARSRRRRARRRRASSRAHGISSRASRDAVMWIAPGSRIHAIRLSDCSRSSMYSNATAWSRPAYLRLTSKAKPVVCSE